MALAFTGDEMPCCRSGQGCEQGLQQMDCCMGPAQTAESGAVMNVSQMTPVSQPNQQHSLTIELACDGHPSSDQDEAPQEDSSLYLQKESFLI